MMNISKAIKKRIKNTNISRIIVFIIMLAYALSMLYAVAWIVMASLKDDAQLLSTNLHGIPTEWFFDNYIEAFKMFSTFSSTSLLGMFLNSFWYSVGSAFVGCMACSITAYIFSKYDFKGKKLLYGIFIVAMILPMYGNFPSKYKLTEDLRLQNSPLFIFVNAAGYGNVMLIFIAGFDVLSWGFAEAAQIDGANDYYIFFRIMFPLIRPVFIAIMLTSIIGSWNDYMNPIIYLPELPTLSAGLYILKFNMRNRSPQYYYAGAVMSFIPTLILFAVFKDTIMNNISAGGIKG